MPSMLMCDRCGASFSKEYHLKRHISTVHEKKRPYICHRTNCDASFGSDHHLKRHINTVHEKKRPYVCHKPKCGSSFSTEYNLKRHSLRLHIKKRNFNCSQCSKAFNTRYELRAHERNVHGTKIKTSNNTIHIEKPSYECAECGYNFVTKGNLVRHISEKHVDKEYFECHTCGCRYNSKKYLEKHIFEKHCDCEQVDCMPMKKRLYHCIICEKSLQFRYQIETHYQEFHNINLDTEKHTFPTMQDFLNWKQNIEDSTTTRFRLLFKSKWKFVYICHRSGPIIVKSSDRKRALWLKGSKKLDGMCPASITLLLNRKDSSCVATFLQTHVGHQSNDKTELKHCFPRKEDCNKLAGMVASGIPKRRILDDQAKVCTNLLYDFNIFDTTNVSRNDLLTNKDLCNVENTYNVVVNMVDNLAKKIQECSLEELDIIGNHLENLEAALQSSKLKNSLPLISSKKILKNQ